MNNKVFMLPTDDRYLLGVLNSPLMWWHNWRYLPHMKDEALSPAAFLMKDLPIAEPRDEIRAGVTAHVERLLAITASQHDTARTLLDWLKVEHEIEKPTQRLQAFVDLDSDGFVAEIKKIRGRKNRFRPRPSSTCGMSSPGRSSLRRPWPARRWRRSMP